MLIISSVFCVIFASTVASAGLDEVGFLIAHHSNLLSRYGGVQWDTGLCKEKEMCLGGYCMLSNINDVFNRLSLDTIILNTGNTLGGSIWWDMFRETGAIRLSQYLGKMYTVLGAQELLLGGQVMEKYINGINSTRIAYLACNLEFPSKSPFARISNKFSKSKTFTVNGTKVAIIGFTTAKVTQTEKSKEEVKILDEIPEIIKEANLLTSEGVNIIIAFGFADIKTGEAIVRQLPMIDIVAVGGLGSGSNIEDAYNSDNYPSVIVSKSGRRSIVLHSFDGGYSSWLGAVVVRFNYYGYLIQHSGRMFSLTNDLCTTNTRCERNIGAMESIEVESFLADIKSMKRVVIGQIYPVLDIMRHDCTYKECNMGNFVADAILEYSLQDVGEESIRIKSTFGYPTAVILPAYALSSSINSTGVSIADIIHAVSGSSRATITSFSINSNELMKVFEEVAYQIPGLQFLQVSGLNIHYDLRMPKDSRVVYAYIMSDKGLVPKFVPLQSETSVRLLTLTSLLEHNFLPSLKNIYDTEIMQNTQGRELPLDHIIGLYVHSFKLFKRPCVEDRIIISCTSTMFISQFVFMLVTINILFLD